MTQSLPQWNATVVHDLLHYPHRLLQHHTWSAVIAEAGGIHQLRQQLLAFPLKIKERRVLEVILANPEDSISHYTDRLAIHHATFHRQQNALCRSLSAFLNLDQVPGSLAKEDGSIATSARIVLPWTSFIGRKHDLVALDELLMQGNQWLSLVGAGGVGKTRLAIELGQHCLGKYYDEVHVLRFAEVQQVEDVGLACIEQLQLSLSTAQSVEHVIQEFFEQRRSLVIVDNLEHIPAAAHWLASIFQPLPQQHVIATSRIRLNVPHEQIYSVEPLAYPPETTAIAQIAAYPAVQLYLDRMEAMRLVDRDDSALLLQVGQICRHVAGLPLAIELVAARTAEYELETISDIIANDLAFIGEGPLDADIRQQTMAATIEWSYRLLPSVSQQVLCKLAVFQAGWDSAAAAAVSGLEIELMNDHLALLVDNHLITQLQNHDHQPYGILEPIRQYVWSLMASATQQQLRLSHCDYYITWVMPTEDLLIGSDYMLWLQSMREAYPNIQLALHTARAAKNPLRLWQLLGALYRFWWKADLIVEGQTWSLPQVPRLMQPSDYPYWQARALYSVLTLGWKDTPNYSREKTFTYLVQLAQKHQFKLIEARAKNFYGILIRSEQTASYVNELFMDAIRIYREIGDDFNLLTPIFNYANSLYAMRRLEEAYELYAELLEKFKINGDYDGILNSMKNMSIVCIYLQRYKDAEAIILAMNPEEDIEPDTFYPIAMSMFLIKIYFFLGEYAEMDTHIRKIYPLTSDNTIFLDRLITICESIIYIAIHKEYYPIVFNIYQYMLNAVESEQYELSWHQSEFIDQTKIVLSQYYDQLEFVRDEHFELNFRTFNDMINYFLRCMYEF